MKIAFYLLALLPIALAIKMPSKAVIVTYPDDTPDSVLKDAKDAITQAGGKITHEYSLFKGFAAQAPVAALETVQALESKYNPVIEDDQIVNASG